MGGEDLVSVGERDMMGIFNGDEREGVKGMKGFIQAEREGELFRCGDMMVRFRREEKE